MAHIRDISKKFDSCGHEIKSAQVGGSMAAAFGKPMLSEQEMKYREQVVNRTIAMNEAKNTSCINQNVPWSDQGQKLLDSLVPDNVNHPSHYKSHPSGVECIDITEHMNFNIGNAVKYLWRCGYKASMIEDLQKAIWYINREIERISK